MFTSASKDSFYLVPALVMGAKVGNAVTMGTCYNSNSYLFPTLFAATAIGVCNFIAKFLTIIAPILAQQDQPLPMVVFAAVSIGSLALVQFLEVPKSGNPDELLVDEGASILNVKESKFIRAELKEERLDQSTDASSNASYSI